jgi:hypothetical protein
MSLSDTKLSKVSLLSFPEDHTDQSSDEFEAQGSSGSSSPEAPLVLDDYDPDSDTDEPIPIPVNNPMKETGEKSIPKLRQRLSSRKLLHKTKSDGSLPTMSPRTDDFVEEISPLRQGGDELFKFENFNLLAYCKREMLGIGEPGHLDSESVEHIQNFLAIPSKLESLLCFGFFICLDAFLFVLTFLPVRAIFSLYLLAKEVYYSHRKTPVKTWKIKFLIRDSGIFFHRSNLYDLLRGLLLLIGCFSLQWLDMSRVYHFIRGQTMIKLYVLTAMMEMLDKLFASFGQDVFGSLYWQTRTNPQNLPALLKLFLVSSIYVALHSTIYFINVATLAVAVNSSDRALLTVLILNNTSEIKSFVFKKFDKINLFQLSCSDITERFHIILFLICISIGGIAQAGPMWFDAMSSHLFIMLMFIAAEMISDSVKHAFIAKFNDIDASIYEDFLKVLRNDVLNSHKERVILDQTYAITRRVGLSQVRYRLYA